MKIFIVTVLLGISLMSLIIGLDLFMGSNFNEALPNLRKPFEVTDPAEYVILFVLLFYLIFKPIFVSLANKRSKASTKK